MPILKVKEIELYYEEYGEGERYVIQAQQFINSHLNYVKDLAEKEGFHGYIIRIRGYAPSTLITEDLGESWYDVWAQDVTSRTPWESISSSTPDIRTAPASAGICA